MKVMLDGQGADEQLGGYHGFFAARHAALLRSGRFATFRSELAAGRIGIVNLDQPMFRNSLPPSARATSSVGYIRVHGRNYKDWFRKTAGRDERYDYLYSAAELKPWAERTKALALEPSVTDVYVVNNNHFAGQAVTNALMLEAQVTRQPVKAPETLLKAYPEELSRLI